MYGPLRLNCYYLPPYFLLRAIFVITCTPLVAFDEIYICQEVRCTIAGMKLDIYAK